MDSLTESYDYSGTVQRKMSEDHASIRSSKNGHMIRLYSYFGVKAGWASRGFFMASHFDYQRVSALLSFWSRRVTLRAISELQPKYTGNRFKGNYDSVTLDNLATLTSKSGVMLQEGWLTIAIDSVQSPMEGRRLALEDWETRKMRLAIACPPAVAETILKSGSRNRYLVLDVDVFSHEELGSLCPPTI